MKAIRIYDNKKLIAYVYLSLDYNASASREEVIASLARAIPETSVGYAGYKTRGWLRESLRRSMFDESGKHFEIKLDKKEIIRLTKEAIRLCHRTVPSKPTYIFVFPCFKPIEKKLSGITGYSPWYNTILTFINPAENWRKAIKELIGHEFTHAIIENCHQNPTLLDRLIYDGLAEIFQEEVIRERPALWANLFSVKECKDYLQKLKKLLKSRDKKLFAIVFFGIGGKYPHWLGYAIGYKIVKAFRKKHPELSWKEIFDMRARKIFEDSGF